MPAKALLEAAKHKTPKVPTNSKSYFLLRRINILGRPRPINGKTRDKYVALLHRLGCEFKAKIKDGSVS
jgi:hypothetical protein